MNKRYSLAVAHTKTGHKVLIVDTKHAKVLDAAVAAEDTERVDIYKNGAMIKKINPAAKRLQREAAEKKKAAEAAAKKKEAAAKKKAEKKVAAEAADQPELPATETAAEE